MSHSTECHSKGVNGSFETRPAILTEEEIRIFLSDYAELNRLLGKTEFNSLRIKTAVKFTIRRWNETLPLVGSVPENSQTFPFPNLLLTGVCSYLLLSESIHRNRNRLAYQSDGTTIDDQAMADVYLQMGQQLKQEFDNHAKHLKIARNIKNGFGQVASEYGFNYLFKGDSVRS